MILFICFILFVFTFAMKMVNKDAWRSPVVTGHSCYLTIIMYCLLGAAATMEETRNGVMAISAMIILSAAVDMGDIHIRALKLRRDQLWVISNYETAKKNLQESLKTSEMLAQAHTQALTDQEHQFNVEKNKLQIKTAEVIDKMVSMERALNARGLSIKTSESGDLEVCYLYQDSMDPSVQAIPLPTNWRYRPQDLA